MKTYVINYILESVPERVVEAEFMEYSRDGFTFFNNGVEPGPFLFIHKSAIKSLERE